MSSVNLLVCVVMNCFCLIALCFPHLSISCWLSFFCSDLLLTCWAEALTIEASTLVWWDSVWTGWGSLSSFWELAVEEPVLSLPLRDMNLSSASFLFNWDPPNIDPEVRRSRSLKISSDNVPHFSSLSWMRLQRLRASAFAAIPVRGQVKVGRVWVRLRGLPSQSSVGDERGSERRPWGVQLPLSGPGLSISSSSSGDSDRDASPIWDNRGRLIRDILCLIWKTFFVCKSDFGLVEKWGTYKLQWKKYSHYLNNLKSLLAV